MTRLRVWLQMFGWPIHDGSIVMGGKEECRSRFFPTHGPKAAREWATRALLLAWANSRSFPLVRMTRLRVVLPHPGIID
jgi:hypothetical protein